MGRMEWSTVSKVCDRSMNNVVHICQFQKIQLFDQLIILQRGQLNESFETKLFRI